MNRREDKRSQKNFYGIVKAHPAYSNCLMQHVGFRTTASFGVITNEKTLYVGSSKIQDLCAQGEGFYYKNLIKIIRIKKSFTN